jgi:acyl-CoA hydrolase
MKSNPGQEREITMRFLAEPSDINIFGKVHGGAAMKWIDQAGYACAVGWSGLPCVTVYVGSIRFHKPILIGDLVEIHTKLMYTGKTSMHIMVDVSAGDPKDRDLSRTTQCVIVFVAIDDDGRPVDIPTWKPVTKDDQALEKYAVQLMEASKQIDEGLEPYR